MLDFFCGWTGCLTLYGCLSLAPDQVDISKYTALFNAHLQVCVDRLVLPVASDLAYLMLSRKVPVDGAVLPALLHKLGKQNQWQRARELFRRKWRTTVQHLSLINEYTQLPFLLNFILLPVSVHCLTPTYLCTHKTL